MSWVILLVAAFVGALLLMQILVARRARQSEGRPAPDTSAIDGQARDANRRVYYFFSPHCGPCKAATRAVDKLRPSHPNLIKVDVRQTADLAREFGIVATPSFVVVEDGKIAEVLLGAQSERKLRERLG